MQVSVEKTSSLGRRVTIEVPAEQVDQEESVKIKELAGKARIDGFRPGKVPMRLIKQRYGKQVRQEAINKILETSLYQALQEQKLNPANTPNVEEIKNEQGQNLTYTVAFEIFPEFEIKDFSNITLDKPKVEISESDLDKGIEKLQSQLATWSEVTDRVAANGDKLKIDFVGYIDGEEFAGGKAEDVDIELGAGQFIPGFEEGLVGAALDSENTIDVTFPEDYHSKDVAGKPAQFKIKVKTISAKTLAELNSDFAKDIGIEDGDAAKIRDKVKENMQNYIEEKVTNDLRDQAIEKLYEAYSDVEIPQALIIRQQEAILQQQKRKLEDLSPAEADEVSAEAKKNVTISLIVNEIIAKHDIKADQEKVAAKIDNLVRMYGNNDMIRKMYYESKELLKNVENMVLADQATDLIVAGATIEEKASSFDEIANG